MKKMFLTFFKHYPSVIFFSFFFTFLDFIFAAPYDCGNGIIIPDGNKSNCPSICMMQCEKNGGTVYVPCTEGCGSIAATSISPSIPICPGKCCGKKTGGTASSKMP